jgi:hypothetical protein
MAGRRSLGWFLGIGALLLGLVSIWVEPVRQVLLSYCGATIAIGIATGPLAHASPPPVVVDPAADVRYIGSRTAGVEHFQNVFYGQDTSGAHRFAPPVAVTHARSAGYRRRAALHERRHQCQ